MWFTVHAQMEKKADDRAKICLKRKIYVGTSIILLYNFMRKTVQV